MFSNVMDINRAIIDDEVVIFWRLIQNLIKFGHVIQQWLKPGLIDSLTTPYRNVAPSNCPFLSLQSPWLFPYFLLLLPLLSCYFPPPLFLFSPLLSQGWHDNNSQPIKAGFFGWLLLAFFKEILKKTAFYFFSFLSTTNVFKALD